MTAEHAAAAGGEVEALVRKAADAAFLAHVGRPLDEAEAQVIERDGEGYLRDLWGGWMRAGLSAVAGDLRATAADTVLATARRLCCGDNPAPEHAATHDHSQRMAFAEEVARAVRGS